MVRILTPGLLAGGMLALLAGCKHHCHQSKTDVPIVHAPLVGEPGGMILPPQTATSVPVGIIAGPLPRAYIPSTQAIVPEPTSELPKPVVPKIPEAKPQSLPVPEKFTPMELIPSSDVRPTMVVPLSKKSESEPSVTQPVLNGPALPGVPTGDPFIAAPVRMFAPASKVEIITSPKDTSVEAQPMKLKAGERFGRAADFRWVAGVLDKHQRGGFWTLRYADYSADDPWGGKVRLVDDPRLSQYRNGDYLYLEGDLLAPTSGANENSGYPPFRIQHIRPIDSK